MAERCRLVFAARLETCHGIQAVAVIAVVTPLVFRAASLRRCDQFAVFHCEFERRSEVDSPTFGATDGRYCHVGQHLLAAVCRLLSRPAHILKHHLLHATE